MVEIGGGSSLRTTQMKLESLNVLSDEFSSRETESKMLLKEAKLGSRQTSIPYIPALPLFNPEASYPIPCHPRLETSMRRWAERTKFSIAGSGPDRAALGSRNCYRDSHTSVHSRPTVCRIWEGNLGECSTSSIHVLGSQCNFDNSSCRS
jgi:hypothetical protein